MHGLEFISEMELTKLSTKRILKLYKCSVYFKLKEPADFLRNVLKGARLGVPRYSSTNNKRNDKFYRLSDKALDKIVAKINSWPDMSHVPAGKRIVSAGDLPMAKDDKGVIINVSSGEE